MTGSFRKHMIRELCNSEEKFWVLFLFAVVAGVLMFVWLPFTDPGSGTQVIVVMNLVLSGGFIALSGYFIWQCRRRRDYREE